MNIPCMAAQQCYHQEWFALNLSYLKKCETKMHLKGMNSLLTKVLWKEGELNM